VQAGLSSTSGSLHIGIDEHKGLCIFIFSGII